MTRSVALYIFTLSLHAALIVVVLQFRIDKRHPIFVLLLMTSLLSNLALVALRLAREREAYIRLAERADWMWYALAVAALAWAVVQAGARSQEPGVRIQDAASGIIIRGLVLMLAMTIVGRYGAGVHLAGGVGPVVARACNLAYVAPTVYLILALSNVGVDLLKIMDRARSFAALRMTAESAAGWARVWFV